MSSHRSSRRRRCNCHLAPLKRQAASGGRPAYSSFDLRTVIRFTSTTRHRSYRPPTDLQSSSQPADDRKQPVILQIETLRLTRNQGHKSCRHSLHYDKIRTPEAEARLYRFLYRSIRYTKIHQSCRGRLKKRWVGQVAKGVEISLKHKTENIHCGA